MTRTAIRHMVFALAALALVFGVASSARAAETMEMMRTQHMHDELVNIPKGHATNNSTSSEGLTTKKRPHASGWTGWSKFYRSF